MQRRELLAGMMALGSVGACSKFQTYDGPEVTRIVVQKENRRMFLLNDEDILEAYDVELGFAPVGHKQREGDGRTPEGDYVIDRRNPESSFYLSLGISYPNTEDVARARELGVSPGGDIFIHGRESGLGGPGPDWTAGCISVNNREMREIYAMVQTGTVISIYP